MQRDPIQPIRTLLPVYSNELKQNQTFLKKLEEKKITNYFNHQIKGAQTAWQACKRSTLDSTPYVFRD